VFAAVDLDVLPFACRPAHGEDGKHYTEFILNADALKVCRSGSAHGWRKGGRTTIVRAWPHARIGAYAHVQYIKAHGS